MTSEEGEVKRVRTEQKGKRTHACGQQCGDSWGGGQGKRGLNVNEKNIIKSKSKK